MKGSGKSAARDAFRAASQLWEGLEALNHELADELQMPLRIGIGLHVGTAAPPLGERLTSMSASGQQRREANCEPGR